MIVNLRFGACFAVTVFLAACGQVLSGNHSSGFLPPSNAERVHSLLGARAKATPAYSIAIEQPHRVIRSNYLDRNVGSVKATTYVPGRKKPYRQIIEAPAGCPEEGTGTKVSGCEILFAGKTKLKIKRATFLLYRAAKGKGCILARGSFEGEAAFESPVVSSFTPENTKTCWKWFP
jgi:hypothetical protein